jgi:hypothetical protein
MSASASPEAAFGGAPAGGPNVIRSVGSCFGWLLLSFGLWGFAWIYNNLTEIGNAMRKDTNATLKTVLYLVPIVNLFVLYFVWKDVDEFVEGTGEQGFSVILYTLLTIFIPFAAIFTFISVQNKLNAAWTRATNGSAEKAELGTFGLVTVIVGVLFWIFYIGIFVLAGALSN